MIEMINKELGELAEIQTGPFGSQLHKEDYSSVGTPIVTVEHLGKRKFTKQNLPLVSDKDKERLSKYILAEGDIVFSRVGSVDRCSYVDDTHTGWMFSGRCLRVRPGKEIWPLYLYYFFCCEGTKQFVRNIAVGATMPSINTKLMGEIPVAVPDLRIQKSIASILDTIDSKIELNERINENLEQQLVALFIHDFADDITIASTDTCPMLGDLITVIDNRGKTPPLTTETLDYPIIDVGALKGSGRIVDFNNCTKYVEQSTYENWFRSGHPQPWDILISTVGSLAEMKIYLGSKGCMAQNVVALRATSISPLYLYQYLRFIRADLVAYNIGSVQPSIKVTHIVKHPIFIPERSKLEHFEETAKAVTNQLYANYNENEALKNLRDTLLPKLMSGELDVSELDL